MYVLVERARWTKNGGMIRKVGYRCRGFVEERHEADTLRGGMMGRLGGIEGIDRGEALGEYVGRSHQAEG